MSDHDTIEKIVSDMRECSIGNRHDAAMIDDWADRLASLRQVPDRPCPFVVQSAEGTAYCRLAESSNSDPAPPTSGEESPTVTAGGVVEVHPAKAIRYATMQGNIKKATPAQAGAELPGPLDHHWSRHAFEEWFADIWAGSDGAPVPEWQGPSWDAYIEKHQLAFGAWDAAIAAYRRDANE